MTGKISNNNLIKLQVDTLSYKTISANKETAQKEWVVVDATDLVLGRMGSEVAKILRGKHKASFTPHVDCGDNVIIINSDKVRMTGDKWNSRVYYRYSGHPGGQRGTSAAEIVSKRGSEELVRRVVKGMLPKNKLGNKVINNLHIFAGAEHNMQAQQPKQIELKL